jgi:isocitrate dehydrogenase
LTRIPSTRGFLASPGPESHPLAPRRIGCGSPEIVRTIEDSMATKTPITVAYGDGIGPEIMEAVLLVIESAGAQIEKEVIEIGEQVYQRGFHAGIEPSSWESLRRTKVFFKAPITTPPGKGFASLNVTARKTLGLYANVRPFASYHPYIRTKHPVMDVVIVRENEEDLYAGIEHRQTHDVYQSLKLISRPGAERLIRYAFEYARANDRKSVACFSKDNIMKFTDGLFHQVFDELGEEYPELEKEHWIVDAGAAKLADSPELFDVIVMPNLYGDILSDVAAQVTGSVGLGGSANIGDEYAMFEAIHGSAPRRAGQNLANPSGLLYGALLMLVHIGQAEVAERVHNAWLTTIEEGIHTYDIFAEDVSTKSVGTKEFAQAIVDRLGRKPTDLKPAHYGKSAGARSKCDLKSLPRGAKQTVGVDVFLDHAAIMPAELGTLLESKVHGDGLKLASISNRGVQVYPEGFPETFTTDHWCCRFLSEEGAAVSHAQIIALLSRMNDAGLDFIKIENLCTFDGKRGYSE